MLPDPLPALISFCTTGVRVRGRLRRTRGWEPVFSKQEQLCSEIKMAEPIEETRLRRAALTYVMDLHCELTQENGAPPLGTQNQAVDFILGDPQLRRALAALAAIAEIDEAITVPRRRPPQDPLYHRVRGYLEDIMGTPVFAAAKQSSR